MTLRGPATPPLEVVAAAAHGPALPPAVAAALDAAGLRAVPRATPGGAPLALAPALAWLARVDADALATVRSLAADGRQVLAVAERAAALAGGAAWELLDAGACDALGWDASGEAAAAIAARLRRWAEVDALLASPAVQSHLLGDSPAWRAAVRQLVELAAFTDVSILLLGESGVGKEEAARLVHALDRRRDKRALVVLDCTTVSRELAGSEFFGHERGAFTGAAGAREGAFALADGGTLFLDEVGELPLSLQSQLLRVIQEGTYKRVGADVWRRVDLRLVCATNRDLEAEVARGRFRRDLYHRISAAVCRLPPLRERASDVLPLARRFLGETLARGVTPALDPAVEAYLQARAYPGNVRDLRQLALRMGKRHVGAGPLTVGDIPPDERPRARPPSRLAPAAQEPGLEAAVRAALAQGVGLKDIGRRATEIAIRLVVAEEGGNLQRAARRLGVTDRALQFRRARRSAGEA